MIIDSPAVRERISTQSKFAFRNTTLHKDFSGGFLSGVGANVASDLAGASVQLLLLDEVDRMAFDVEEEGSPVELAVARTAVYHRKKIFMGSTPVNEDTSMVLKWFEEGDQRYYFVPCPHCGHFQTFEIERLKNTPDGAVFECENCLKPIPENLKTKMLEAGQWRPTADPMDPTYRSYHLNSLYSPVGFLSWGDVLKSQHRSENDHALERSFRNLYLGLPSKNTLSETPIPKDLKARSDAKDAPPRPPKESMLLTMGVDIQQNRIETLLCGFNRRRMAILDHTIIHGDSKTEEVLWDQLYDHIVESDAHYTAVDSGFLPHQVFAFQKKYRNGQIKVIKGTHTEEFFISLPKYMEVTASGTKRQKLGNKYFQVATNLIKDEIYSRLMITDPDSEQFIWFPPGLTSEFFAQVCSEKKVLRHPGKEMDRTGSTNPYKWVATRHRNEVLDMMVYCLSMYYLSGAAKKYKSWANFIARMNQKRGYHNRRGQAVVTTS